MPRIPILFLLFAVVLWSKNSSENLTLTVKADGFHNNRGYAIVMLYDTPGSIPDKTLSRYRYRKIVPIKNGKVRTNFSNLKSGRFAVSLFHDENSNGMIDKGLMLPTEGVGLSNFKSVNLFHPPSFNTASFQLNKNRTVIIHMIYF